ARPAGRLNGLIGVLERRSEIGLRRALGAPRRQRRRSRAVRSPSSARWSLNVSCASTSKRLDAINPTSVTCSLLAIAAVILILGHTDGIYLHVPALIAVLVGGVVNAWLILVRLTDWAGLSDTHPRSRSGPASLKAPSSASARSSSSSLATVRRSRRRRNVSASASARCMTGATLPPEFAAAWDRAYDQGTNRLE